MPVTVTEPPISCHICIGYKVTPALPLVLRGHQRGKRLDLHPLGVHSPRRGEKKDW